MRLTLDSAATAQPPVVLPSSAAPRPERRFFEIPARLITLTRALQSPLLTASAYAAELKRGATTIAGIANAAAAHAAAPTSDYESCIHAADAIERLLGRESREDMRTEVCGPDDAAWIALIVTTASTSEHFASHKASAIETAERALVASGQADIIPTMRVFGEDQRLPTG